MMVALSAGVAQLTDGTFALLQLVPTVFHVEGSVDSTNSIALCVMCQTALLTFNLPRSLFLPLSVVLFAIWAVCG